MKKAASAFLILISLISMFSFASCKDESSSKIYTYDGLEFSSVEVLLIEENYFNLNVKILNKTAYQKSLDLSRLHLKLSSGAEIKHYSGVENCPAGASTPFSIMIDDDHPEMHKGDKITVYYDEDEVCKIKITEL